jgi:hypothetical protein
MKIWLFFFNFFNWFFFNFIHQYFILFYFYVKFGPYFSNYYLFCFSLFFIDYFFNSIPQHFIDWGFDFVIFASLPSMKLVTISWFGSQVLKISLSWFYFFRSFLKTNIFFKKIIFDIGLVGGWISWFFFAAISISYLES